MTPKEKARELVNEFNSEQCALFCVDEMIRFLWHNHDSNSEKMYRYYIEVKQEIGKL